MQWATLSFSACPFCGRALPSCHFWFHSSAGLSCFEVLDEVNSILPHVSVSLSCFRDLLLCSFRTQVCELFFIYRLSTASRELSYSKISHFCLPIEAQVFFFFWKSVLTGPLNANGYMVGLEDFIFIMIRENCMSYVNTWCRRKFLLMEMLTFLLGINC